MKKHLDYSFIDNHYGERFRILRSHVAPVFEMYTTKEKMGKYVCYDGKPYVGMSTLATGQEPDEENPDAD